MIKLNASQLRSVDSGKIVKGNIERNPITLILDDVLDTYNVGAIFRLADAVSCEKIYLCGQTPTPPNSRIKKASINTWKWVEWEYVETAARAVSKSKMNNAKCKIISVEQDAKSKMFYEVEYEFPLAIVVGNETHGVSKEMLKLSDEIVELPMWGINKSLNVMVSLGIVLYEVMKQKKD